MTPDRIQPASSFDAVLERADQLVARYGEACDRHDAAGNPITRAISRVSIALCAADLRDTEQLAIVELQREQFANGSVPMVED